MHNASFSWCHRREFFVFLEQRYFVCSGSGKLSQILLFVFLVVVNVKRKTHGLSQFSPYQCLEDVGNLKHGLPPLSNEKLRLLERCPNQNISFLVALNLYLSFQA